jgi:coenzyme F420-0:L-glutamate ligase/coenzyme F420-1:gamma-L-glutamate ligase
MNEKIELIGIKKIPLIKKGDNIAEIITQSLKAGNLTLKEGDIIVIAQSIVSKSCGYIKNLKEISPSKEAYQIYENMVPKAQKFNIPEKTPELIQAIIDESKEIIKKEHVIIVETNHGFICANAGIDKSNVNGEDNVTLLPKDSDKEAEKVRVLLKKMTGKNIAVIISDSFGRPFRRGAVGVAIGISGIDALLDKRGSKDLFGKILQSTIIGQIDSLASAAQLIMGEADEGLPVVIIRGYKYKFSETASVKEIIREKSDDLFRAPDEEKIFTRVLKSRRSYKSEFEPEKITSKEIEECIDIARYAPSAHNGQYWRYIILEQDSIRDYLIEKMNKKLKSDLKKDGKSDLFISQKTSSRRETFLKAPILVLLCLDTEELEEYNDPERDELEYLMGVQSVSSSATYLLLTLEAKGYASCWYCAPLFAKEIVKEVLNLPQSYIPMAFFTVGRAKKSPNMPKRKNLNEIIFKI